MSVLKSAKLKLAKMLSIKLGEIETDKDKLYFDGDSYSVGTEVYGMDEEGNYVMPESGTYVSGDDTIVVTDGVISEINGQDGGGNGGNQIPEEVAQNIESVIEIVKDLTNELIEVQSEVLELKEQKKELAEKLKAQELKLSEAISTSAANVVANTPIAQPDGKSKLEKFYAQRKV